MLQQKNEMPARSTLIVWAEFIELTGTTPERLHELVDMGWVTPTRTADSVLLFRRQRYLPYPQTGTPVRRFRAAYARRFHCGRSSGSY